MLWIINLKQPRPSQDGHHGIRRLQVKNETEGAHLGAHQNETDEQLMRVCVLNDQGLHARPAARLAQRAQEFQSDLRLGLDGQEVDAKSILDVLTLAAGKGSVLTLRASGPDAQTALDCLAEMFKNRFK